MRLTYGEILDSMKTAFQEEKGESVKELSDLEMRFKAVASEIFSLFSFGDYILKQGFVQTATGEYLDRHAAMRSIKRKNASYAKGTLLFSLLEAMDKTVTVPAGTVCSVAGKPFIQFATDKAVEIKPGQIFAQAAATALKPGDEYNAGANTVTVIVNPPAYIYSVTNEQAFCDGYDAESDESLRERVINSYRVGENMLSIAGIRDALLTIDEITDAIVYPGPDYFMNVCLKTKSGKISAALQKQVEELLGFTKLCSVDMIFEAAKERPFYAYAEAKILSGYDGKAIENAVEARITQFCSSEKIGANYSESAAAAACGGIEGLEYVGVTFGTDSGSTVACGTKEYLKLKGVEVIVHE